jgi:MFS family permease
MLAAPVLAVPFITDLNMLYLTQIISGFGRGLAFPLLMQHSVAHIEAHQKATAMGYFQSIYGIGMVLGPVILGILGDRMGLGWGFWAIGCIGLLGTAAAAFWLSSARKIAQTA